MKQKFIWVVVLLFFTGEFIFARSHFELMTINAAQMPWPLGMKNNEKRMKQLIAKINSMPNQPNVICVQELFTHEGRIQLTKGIRDNYPYSYVDHRPGRKLIGVNSGLAIFSKHPIVDKMIYQYQYQLGDGNFTKKGVLGAKIQLSADKFAFIFTTHMQAGRSDWFIPLDLCKDEWDADKASVIQTKEAIEQIDNFVKQDFAPIFYAGDFNINVDDKDEVKYYEQILEVLGAIDTFDGVRSRYHATAWEHAEKNEAGRIDYILELGPYPASPGYSIITDYFDKGITDHLASIGIFEII